MEGRFVATRLPHVRAPDSSVRPQEPPNGNRGRPRPFWIGQSETRKLAEMIWKNRSRQVAKDLPTAPPGEIEHIRAENGVSGNYSGMSVFQAVPEKRSASFPQGAMRSALAPRPLFKLHRRGPTKSDRA